MQYNIVIIISDKHSRGKHSLQHHHTANRTRGGQAQEFECLQETQRANWRSKPEVLHLRERASQVSSVVNNFY